jgi:phosphate transport system protein
MATHFINLLDELMRRSLRMGAAVEDMLLEACEAVTQADHTLARRIVDRDAEIDAEEVAIEAEAVRLMTLFQPMGADMRRLCTILKVNNDLERIADCGVNIAERAAHLEPDMLVEPRHTLRDIYPVVRRMLHGAIHAYATLDRDAAEKVMAEDEVIDAFYGDFIRNLVADASSSPETMAAHLDVLSIAKNLERTADHAVNIAEDVVFLVTGQIIRHGPKKVSGP